MWYHGPSYIGMEAADGINLYTEFHWSIRPWFLAFDWPQATSHVTSWTIMHWDGSCWLDKPYTEFHWSVAGQSCDMLWSEADEWINQSKAFGWIIIMWQICYIWVKVSNSMHYCPRFRWLIISNVMLNAVIWIDISPTLHWIMNGHVTWSSGYCSFDKIEGCWLDRSFDSIPAVDDMVVINIHLKSNSR